MTKIAIFALSFWKTHITADMKRIIATIAFILTVATLSAQTPKNVKYVFTEASDLNLIGKIHENTPNPYHRVDTAKYKGFTVGENRQVRCGNGIAVLFKTNSTTISVKCEYGWKAVPMTSTMVSIRGFDLYIHNGKDWVYAAAGVNKEEKENDNLVIIRNMDGKEKQCMLYLPIYSELKSLQIGVQEGSYIEALESPFRHRIGIFGSSFTHGASTTRSGMTYPMQLMRWTGLQFLNLGCSGNGKLQAHFAKVLCDADVDALVFDMFSNPSIKIIEERLVPFIEEIQAAHPDIPLVFQQTIYRERRNFDCATDAFETKRQETAARMMKEACRKYKNVYFIQTNAADKRHETSVDGTHPSDYGYTLWAESIRKPLLKIFRKYGIK